MTPDVYGWNGYPAPADQAWWYTTPLPTITGSQYAVPLHVQPRVFTVATSEGRARTCVGGGEFRYHKGDRMEVTLAQETPRGTFFLVVSPQGCAGWVPARHVSAGRGRGRGPGGDEGGPDAFDVEMDVPIVAGEEEPEVE